MSPNVTPDHLMFVGIAALVLVSLGGMVVTGLLPLAWLVMGARSRRRRQLEAATLPRLTRGQVRRRTRSKAARRARRVNR